MAQVSDEEVQDRRAGGGGPRAEQERVRAAVEQRPAAGAGQVRSRLVPPPPLHTPTSSPHHAAQNVHY